MLAVQLVWYGGGASGLPTQGEELIQDHGGQGDAYAPRGPHDSATAVFLFCFSFLQQRGLPFALENKGCTSLTTGPLAPRCPRGTLRPLPIGKATMPPRTAVGEEVL